MKVIFFGLGSIGRRHAKILLDNFDYQIFAFRTKEGSRGEHNFSKVKDVYSWDEVREIKPDVAFITNPTFMHIDTALRCVQLDMKLFIEKPIGHSLKGLDLLIDGVTKKKLTSYVAYNLRFHPVIVYLKEYLSSKEIYHVSIYNSSYLPNWRPQQNYSKSYSAQVAKGGGVILDLSHEFDYTEYLFGSVSDIRGRFGKASSLEVECEDFLDAAIKTERAEVNLHLDFLSSHSERTIKIDYAGGFILADLLASSLSITEGESHSLKEFKGDISDSYKDQAKYFFENINKSKMMNNLAEASVLFKKILEFKGNFQ